MSSLHWSKANKKRLLEELVKVYPEADRSRTELVHKDPYQLIVAVILSAQCTDDRVNKVTPALFAKYPDFASLAAAELSVIESFIQSCGLYHNKAVNIQSMAKAVTSMGGELPKSVAELTKLPGVGRKTANVVLSVLWDIPALAVDTHVGRVATRLGLSSGNTPIKIEQEVTSLFPASEWNLLHRLFIWHGRKICTARNPSCSKCPVAYMCNWYKGTVMVPEKR